MQTMPAVLCIFIVAYIIYLEIKSPKKDRNLFVDISISVIIMLVGIYSMYEYKFDFKRLVVILYVLLLLMSIAYILLVLHNDKKAKLDETNTLIDTEKEKVSGDENVD
jgi:Ca2+/Na+ antiporter